MSRGGRTGRRPGGPDTRSEILEAARTRFAREGYEGTTIRGVAAAANVDPALVHHYFGTKQELFRAAAAFPVGSEDLVAVLACGPPTQRAEALARFFFQVWESEGSRLQLQAVLRSAMTYDDAAALLRAFIARELLAPVAQRLEVDDAETRVALVATQMVGLAMLRYVIRVEPLASLHTEELVARIVPVIEHHLFGDRLRAG